MCVARHKKIFTKNHWQGVLRWQLPAGTTLAAGRQAAHVIAGLV